MTEAPKEYESVDWHGEHLRIYQDKRGYVSISHPPFETCFNPEEMRKIAQFINKYCPVSAKSDAVLDEKKAILGKLAERLRQEFCQDDDEEYYLSSYDFESVLEEINQEFEDEEELRQQKERERLREREQNV